MCLLNGTNEYSHFVLLFLGMWGLHDRQLILRKLLCDALTNSSSAEAFKRRWRYQQSTIYRQCNLVLSEEEWESDWRFLLQLSSPQPRSVGSRCHGSSLPRSDLVIGLRSAPAVVLVVLHHNFILSLLSEAVELCFNENSVASAKANACG